MHHPSPRAVAALACLLLALGCDDGATADPASDGAAPDATRLDAGTGDAAPADAAPMDAMPVDAALAWVREGAPEHGGVYGFANGCYAVEVYDGRTAGWLTAAGDGYALDEAGPGTPTLMRATDLGSYLLYDAEGHYLATDEAGALTRPATLDSDISRLEDGYVSPAEWVLQPSGKDPARFELRQKASDRFLAADGLTDDAEGAAVLAFYPAEGCAEFPELAVDAEGVPGPRAWPDGEAYGIAELHSHMFTNVAFGGSNMFHGAPFHPLGVEHALPDCAPYHGEGGRRDFVALFYDGGSRELDPTALLPFLTDGQANEFVHETAGWPTFTEWPNAWRRSTHQTMYYRWLERAWRAGLRLVVQHVTGNSVLCEFGVGLGTQVARYGCNDMVTVDRSIQAVRDLERYIDAQWGGPGQGWLRVVTSSDEARAVIAEGKLAVVLGIEISNLFDCFLTPPPGKARCTPESLAATVDRYFEQGVRVVFPVHKFDNGFSPGDGDGGVIELGNFVNSGHFNDQVDDCPLGADGGFDDGPLTFAELNRPRDDYLAPPVLDFSDFAADPFGAIRPHLAAILAGEGAGNYCQKATMTALGETLLQLMMDKGMIPDVAHLPQRSVLRALEILEAADYPFLSTHGRTHDGATLRSGGMTGRGIGGCGDPNQPGRMVRGLTERSEARVAAGSHRGVALGFDLNGFAGARRPRFGEDARCGDQANPVEYPFLSHDEAVSFLPPTLGERAVDFNTEGFIHIGMLPELIEDARRDGATDEELEPLFRSAEGYLRMWAKAEARAAERAAP